MCSRLLQCSDSRRRASVTGDTGRGDINHRVGAVLIELFANNLNAAVSLFLCRSDDLYGAKESCLYELGVRLIELWRCERIRLGNIRLTIADDAVDPGVCDRDLDRILAG